MGALLIATTVPVATPVRATAAKKKSWYPARVTIAVPVAASGHPCLCNWWRLSASTSRAAPPTSRRTAPTAGGVAPVGAKACAVPVVPQPIAAASTYQNPCKCFLFLFVFGACRETAFTDCLFLLLQIVCSMAKSCRREARNSIVSPADGFSKIVAPRYRASGALASMPRGSQPFPAHPRSREGC